MNLLIASFAVFIMIAGLGVVGLTWFYDEVAAPTDFAEAETSTILTVDGKQEIAKLGVNRTVVPVGEISDVVKYAVMAAEDKNFLDHSGIDVKGIARAAWNNFTGGDTQGASTITQQYARHVADLQGITYSRKLREAVLANKIEQDLKKDTILGYYLNAIYFGRGAHGVEAAAKTYFGKSVLTKPGQKNALTFEEAAVLASLIKQPEPDKATGHKGYDPQLNPPAAQERWTYTLNNMADKHWITPEQRAAAKYPKVLPWDPKNNCGESCGVDKPTGNVINYVAAELQEMGIKDWKDGGYRITTSIVPKAQKAAEDAARRASKDSPMAKLPKNYMAALSAVDPGSGRVIAYYGAENGTGFDFAGVNTDATGKLTGGHSPGSTFKIYTLAAALRDNISMDSHWDSTKTKDGEFEISNAGRKHACKKWCSLEEMTLQSYNVPFYWIAKELGPDKVLEAARDAGVRTMWDNDGNPHDLLKTEPSALAPSKFDTQIGYGQYGITVLDHANGLATIANRGMYNKAHFVVKVEKKNLATGKYELVDAEEAKPKRVFDAAKMDDLNAVLQKIPRRSNDDLKGGRPATGKTGTWELKQSSKENGDAWMIGATPQIAAAVWVGTQGKRDKIRERSGSPMGGAGTPASVWNKFMEDAHEALKLPKEKFPEEKNTGDPNHEIANGVSPPPAPPPQDPGGNNCNGLPAWLCPNDGGNDGGGNDGGGNDGGGGDGDGTSPSTPPTRQRFF